MSQSPSLVFYANGIANVTDYQQSTCGTSIIQTVNGPLFATPEDALANQHPIGFATRQDTVFNGTEDKKSYRVQGSKWYVFPYGGLQFLYNENMIKTPAGNFDPPNSIITNRICSGNGDFVSSMGYSVSIREFTVIEKVLVYLDM